MHSKTGITPKKYKVQFKDKGGDWQETYKEDTNLRQVRNWIKYQKEDLPERKFRIIKITEAIVK
jgi:hypothetical protein